MVAVSVADKRLAAVAAARLVAAEAVEEQKRATERNLQARRDAMALATDPVVPESVPVSDLERSLHELTHILRGAGAHTASWATARTTRIAG